MIIRGLIIVCFLIISCSGKLSAQISGLDYFNLSYSSLEQKNNDSAMYYLSRAILLDTTMSNAYFNRGTLRLQHFDFLGAIDDFTNCINLEVSFGRAYNNRGYSFLQVGMNYEGCKDLRIAKDLSVPESMKSFPILCPDFKE